MKQYWQHNIDEWTQAFERLNRGIYFNLSYGEVFGQNGFYQVMDTVGKHSRWEASLVTNLSYPVDDLLKMRIAQDKRVYIHASWHPHGGPNADWNNFTSNLLKLQEAEIPTVVMYLFWPPQIEDWKKYWRWLDEHNFRTCIRRFVGVHDGKPYPQSYTPEQREFLYATVNPKTRKYGVDAESPRGNLCSAGKEMILVRYDGAVSYCADIPNANLGNIFDPDFKLSRSLVRCPSKLCGGDYGMLHMIDETYGPLPDQLWHDCFIAQTENLTGGGKDPVHYPQREKMEKWLNA